MADLAAACSPATRVALGVLRFFTTVMAGVISGMYLLFGVAYDTVPESRMLGAVRCDHRGIR